MMTGRGNPHIFLEQRVIKGTGKPVMIWTFNASPRWSNDLWFKALDYCVERNRKEGRDVTKSRRVGR